MQFWNASCSRSQFLCFFNFVETKLGPRIASLHSPAHSGSFPYQVSIRSEVWFVKVIYTICFQCSKSSMDIFYSDYFRENISSSIAFEAIKHLSKNQSNPRLAFNFFQLIRHKLNLNHLSATYNVLLRSLCQNDLHDLVKLVFDYMKTDGHLLDSSILGILVSSFARAGKFYIAKQLLANVQSTDIKIPPCVYNGLLRLLVEQDRAHEAVHFFRDCILRSHCYSPDTSTFNIVIRGLCRTAEVEKAFAIFNEMQNVGCLPDIITYNILIHGFCRAGEPDRGLELLKEIQSGNGLSPDVVTYTSVILGYCKLGKMEVASNIFNEMISYGVKPSLVTFNVLIDGFGKKGDMPSALNIYENMVSLGCFPDIVTITSLIDGYCRVGQVDQGLKLWDALKSKNLSPNVYTFAILINSLCKENRLNEACDLLRQLKWREDIVPQPFIYNPVIDGLCKSGNVDEANVIVAEMEAKKCNPDKVTFTILIIGHCMKGKMSEAINIFNKMHAIGCAPDRITMRSLVSCLLKAGMPNEAFRITQSVSENLNLVIPSLKRNVPIRTNMDIPVAV
ncbi:hypothetical protein NMG60_11028824 [Bertholletia excelsa]